MKRRLITLLLAAHLVLMPTFVMAQTSAARHPLSYSLREYGFFLGAALFGGIVAWWNKVRAGVIPMWSIHHLIGELVASAFAGLVTFFICEGIGLHPLFTAAITGIAGHMGTKAITLFEDALAKRIKGRAES